MKNYIIRLDEIISIELKDEELIIYFKRKAPLIIGGVNEPLFNDLWYIIVTETREIKVGSDKKEGD